jgi:putative oxidoreductase
MLSQLTDLYTRFYGGVEKGLTPLVLLFVRIWAAKAFFQSGLVKED